MSAYLLQDRFQYYVVMSVVFGLSICMAKCNYLLLGMKMIYWDCFCLLGVLGIF